MSGNLGTAGVVVSASMAIVAAQALAYVGEQSESVHEIERTSVDDEMKARIEAAVSKQDVRQAVSAAFSTLASKFGEDGTSLSAKYFPNAEGRVAQVISSDDFVGSGGCYSNCHAACYSNCHSACHSACHGSRGWR